MLAFGYVQENAVYKKQKGLDVQMLAPAQAQIEKELAQSLVINTLLRLFLKPSNLFLPNSFIPRPHLLRLSI